MRFLLLCTDAYGGHGGIALFNRQLVGALAAHPECEQVVVVPRLIVREQEPLPPNVVFDTAAARGKLAWVSAVRRCAREPFDIVFCGHINLLPATRLLKQWPVLIMHGIEAWKPARRLFIPNLRGAISVSELTRDRFLSWSHFAGPTYVLPNAVRLELYGMRPKRADLVERWSLAGKRVLLTLGRIVAAERYKGFDDVLEVMPDLDADIVYLIAGKGDDIERLRRKARDRGVADRVIFTGFIDEKDKADVYALADVYVMPSRGEGFGFVLLEAMACGIPVIGSKHDGGREALRHGALGTLVDPANPAEIRTAIEDLLRDGKRAIPAGMHYFAYERFVERVRAIVDDVSRRGANPLDGARQTARP
jgi:glycosyltransferase involved in cell wall biosynthesis